MGSIKIGKYEFLGIKYFNQKGESKMIKPHPKVKKEIEEIWELIQHPQEKNTPKNK